VTGGGEAPFLFGQTADGSLDFQDTFPSNSFQVTPDLHTATLSPVTVHGFCGGPASCGSVPAGSVIPVTIQATWTSSGHPQPSCITQHGIFSGVNFIFSGCRTTMPATATGTLNG